MEIIKQCPVCGILVSTPLTRKVFLEADASPSLEDATVFGYRCQNGHVCLPTEGVSGQIGDHSKIAA